jgi:hypothetical protein
MNYQDFIDRKKIVDVPTGFKAKRGHAKLFDFQSDIVRWACQRGRAALFEDCGMGKTPQQLVWAHEVVEETNAPVLIVAPLGVTHQTIREGNKFGIDCKFVTCQAEVSHHGIYVTNYEKLHRFDLSKFKGIVLDESSILKSYDGATRNLLIETCARVPYKLACTATPSPSRPSCLP